MQYQLENQLQDIIVEGYSFEKEWKIDITYNIMQPRSTRPLPRPERSPPRQTRPIRSPPRSTRPLPRPERSPPRQTRPIRSPPQI